jgi:transposase
MASLLRQHESAVQRLAEVPGLGVDSAQQIIAKVGATAATFPSAKQLFSWVGVCPGDEESAGVSKSHRSPKGNRQMRRILDQATNAAVQAKGTIFEIVYRRLVSRLGHNQTIRAVSHRLCRLLWVILHQGVRYEERGPSVNAKSSRRRTCKMIRELRNLGYRIEPAGTPACEPWIFDLVAYFRSLCPISANLGQFSLGTIGDSSTANCWQRWKTHCWRFRRPNGSCR